MIDERYINKKAVELWGPLRFPDNQPDKLLLYEYVRGSHAYGLAVESSDQDRGGVYIQDNTALLGMTARTSMRGYDPVVMSKSHDEVWYELSRFAELLEESNPNILESLFIDPDMVLYEHPLITELRARKNDFVTKQTFPKFGGYAKSQIEKAHGLNKKIVTPVTRLKSPLEFVYTFKDQGSVPIKKFIEDHGLFQELFGLVSIPNMHNTYGAYYDWSAHIDKIGIRDALEKLAAGIPRVYEDWKAAEEFDAVWADLTGSSVYDPVDLRDLLGRRHAGFSGIVGEKSNELRLSSVPSKNDRPILYIVYNQEGYSKHAKDYHDYKKWEENRNQVRYALNVGANYDSKNMMHSFRLITMAIEIAEGTGMILKREADREFLLDIRNHKYTYEELMERLTVLEGRRKAAQEISTIPDRIDAGELNRWIIEQRRKYGELSSI